MPANEAVSVAEALHRRRSVRAFSDKPVDPAVLEAIFAAAQRAPSGGNLQPWQAVVLTGAPWQRVKENVVVVAKPVARGARGPAIPAARICIRDRRNRDPVNPVARRRPRQRLAAVTS